VSNEKLGVGVLATLLPHSMLKAIRSTLLYIFAFASLQNLIRCLPTQQIILQRLLILITHIPVSSCSNICQYSGSPSRSYPNLLRDDRGVHVGDGFHHHLTGLACSRTLGGNVFSMAFVPLAGLFFFSPGPAQNGTSHRRRLQSNRLVSQLKPRLVSNRRDNQPG
jgi:hypothetical protein